MYNKNVVSAGVLLVLILGTTMIVRLSLQAGSLAPITDIDSLTTQIYLEGKYVCLPHRDGTVTSSTTCEAGLKTEGGVYYGLDTHLVDEAVLKKLVVGKSITANGVLSPEKVLNEDHLMKKYDIHGIFSVTDSLHVL
ncbi:MAG: hypothetical protein V4576_04105 [Patescibacteria group bacterium]